MGLRFRKGNESDLQVASLLPGEPVFTTDTEKPGIKGSNSEMVWFGTIDNATGRLKNSQKPVYSASEIVQAPLPGWINSPVQTCAYQSYDTTYKTGVIRFSGDMASLIWPGWITKFTQTAAIQMGIVTAISAYSGTYTDVTIFLGTDYTLTNAAISSVFLAPPKSAPSGFPLEPSKWGLKLTDTTQRSATSGLAAYQNLEPNPLYVPIGIWKHVKYYVHARATCATAATTNFAVIYATLSTSPTAETDTELTARADATNVTELSVELSKEKLSMQVSSPTPLYLNAKSELSVGTNAIYFLNNVSTLLITAECAYL